MAWTAKETSFSSKETPKFPLLTSGEIWHTGWDIPSYWAVDGDNVPYADYSAHGCCLEKTTFDELISHAEGAEDYGTGQRLRQMSGKKPRIPAWAQQALAAGWTPPQGWHRDDYDG